MDSSPESFTRFKQLLAALSRRSTTPLEAKDGLLVLIDSGDAVQLVVELADTGDSVLVVARVMPIPKEDPAGALALRLLHFNADRGALEGAVIAADALRRQFVLIRELLIEADPELVADRIEGLLDLAAAVRLEIAGDRYLRPGTATLLLRANGGAR